MRTRASTRTACARDDGVGDGVGDGGGIRRYIARAQGYAGGCARAHTRARVIACGCVGVHEQQWGPRVHPRGHGEGRVRVGALRGGLGTRAAPEDD